MFTIVSKLTQVPRRSQCPEAMIHRTKDDNVHKRHAISKSSRGLKWETGAD